MIHHSSVSIEDLEARLAEGNGQPGMGERPTPHQKRRLTQWKAQGYTYAPPCNNIRPDGHCAGHERKE